jgi:hypothetical protein
MKSRHPRQRALLLCPALALFLLSAEGAAAQTGGAPQGFKRICPIDRPLPAGLKVRSVRVMGRRGAGPVNEQLEAEAAKLPNREYTVEFHRKAVEIVESALTEEANEFFEKQIGIVGGARTTKLGIASVYTTQCADVNTGTKEVDVLVRVLFLRVDLGNPANNLLLLPRSLAPSFYKHMPAPLRAFNPKFDLDYDRRIGPSAALDLSTNLAELPSLWSGKEKSGDDADGEDGPTWRADLDFNGRKSLSDRFYRTKGKLALSRLRPSHVVEKLDASVSFNADDEPLSEMRHVNNGLRVGGLVKLRPHGGLVHAIYLSGDYSRNVNKVFGGGSTLLSERDQRGSLRSVFDGRVGGGFARAGVWFDTTEVSRTSTNYKRLAGALGYQKEIGPGTQTVGVEAMLGAGKSWGDVPLYARFYGGSSSSNFIYDSPDSPVMTEFPTGPVLRSYGETQAGVGTDASGAARGGRSYWHANLNVSIPVPRWSQPLIPRETIKISSPEALDKCSIVTPEEKAAMAISLSKQLECFSIGSAEGGIADNLLDGIVEELMKKDPTLTEDQAVDLGLDKATKQAHAIVEREIAPSVRYIARHANILAVKPLLMFDAASIGGVEGERRRMRFAAGGGLQLVVVVARAEFGYMRSLPRIGGEPKGNFVFRLTFQNLF